MTLCLAFAALLMGSALPPAQAVPAPELLPATPVPAFAGNLAGFDVVPDDELARNRGGFAWQGIQISLGAEIRTYLNGELVLQTNVSWTDSGSQSQQYVSGALTPVDAAQLQAGILTSGAISMHVGDASVFLANQGQTAFLHRTDGAFQNIVINTTSNVNALQEVDAVLDLGNFGQFESGVLMTRLGNSLGDLVGQATLSGLGH